MGYEFGRGLWTDEEELSTNYRRIRDETLRRYQKYRAEGRTYKGAPDHVIRICYIKKLFFDHYEGGSVLDVGWGGYPLAYDFFWGGEYVGIDFLFHHKKKYPFVQAITCSFDDLPFKEEPLFDFILWSEGPEHSLSPFETLRKLRKVCKGKIILSCPDGGTTNWEHQHIFNLESFKAFLGSQFKVLGAEAVPPHWLIGVGEI